MKKVLSLTLALAMMFTLLAGCGSDDSADTSGTDSSSTSSNSGTSTSTNVGNDAIEATAAGEPEGVQAGTTATVLCGNDYVSQQLPGLFSGGGDVYGAVYDTLFYSPSGQMNDITGLLAETWTVSDDYLTVVINLYEDVYFTNGNNLTAQSVASSFDFHLNERSASLLTNLESYEATGEYEFTITFSIPNINFMTELCIFHTGIFDTTLYEELGCVVEAAYMCGSGPYYISDYAIGDYFVLTAKEDYWNDVRQAHIETVTCKVITNTNTAYSAMAAGELDAMLCQDYEVKEMLEAIDTVNVITDEAPGAASPVWLNSSGQLCSYLTNIRVREAITMMVDAEELALAKSGSYGYVSNNIIASTIDYQEDRVYDPEGALAILAEEGVDPSDLVLTALATAATETAFINIQAQLMECGVTLNFVVQDGPAVMSAGLLGEWDMWVEHGGMSAYSMSTPLGVLMGENAIFNVVGDPDYNGLVSDLVASAFAATTVEDQMVALEEICQILDENYFYVCGTGSERWFAFSDRLGNTTYQYAYYLWQLWDFYVLDA